MIGAILLCAGTSSRMGQPKALLDAGGETFLHRLHRIATGAGAHVVAAIAPPHGEAIRAAFGGDRPITWAENEHPERGMLSSVQAAARRLPAGALGALVWPVDVPFVQAGTVLEVLKAGPDLLVIPQHQGRGGHPIWIPADLLSALLLLPPEAGLRQLRLDHPGRVLLLPVADPAVLRDIDTQQDLARVRALSAKLP